MHGSTQTNTVVLYLKNHCHQSFPSPPASPRRWPKTLAGSGMFLLLMVQISQTTTWDVWHLENSGINDQPQVVSRICAINSSWWLNHPSKKDYIVKLDHFPKLVRVKIKKYLKPSPRICPLWFLILYHHPSLPLGYRLSMIILEPLCQLPLYSVCHACHSLTKMTLVKAFGPTILGWNTWFNINLYVRGVTVTCFIVHTVWQARYWINFPDIFLLIYSKFGSSSHGW